MLLVILAFWFGYKKAKATGRNPWLWAFICSGVFIGTQFVTGFLIGGILGLGIAIADWPEDIYDRYSILITIVAIVVSLVALWLVFRYLDRVPQEPTFDQPPPPPTFDE
jgi:4-amino-4-deoxy-L-arabinose transferase-like glycosyltransferase